MVVADTLGFLLTSDVSILLTRTGSGSRTTIVVDDDFSYIFIIHDALVPTTICIWPFNEFFCFVEHRKMMQSTNNNMSTSMTESKREREREQTARKIIMNINERSTSAECTICIWCGRWTAWNGKTNGSQHIIWSSVVVVLQVNCVMSNQTQLHKRMKVEKYTQQEFVVAIAHWSMRSKS